MESEVPSKLEDGIGLISPRKRDSIEGVLHVNLEKSQTWKVKAAEDFSSLTFVCQEMAQLRQCYASILPG